MITEEKKEKETMKKANKWSHKTNPVILSWFDQNDLEGSTPKIVLKPAKIMKTEKRVKIIFFLGLYWESWKAKISREKKLIEQKP